MMSPPWGIHQVLFTYKGGSALFFTTTAPVQSQQSQYKALIGQLRQSYDLSHYEQHGLHDGFLRVQFVSLASFRALSRAVCEWY
jgi:hypothetical protein